MRDGGAPAFDLTERVRTLTASDPPPRASASSAAIVKTPKTTGTTSTSLFSLDNAFFSLEILCACFLAYVIIFIL